MSATNSIYNQISCFGWQVEKNKTSGKKSLYSGDRLSHYPLKDSPLILRLKFLQVLLTAPVLFLALRPIARTFFLLTGSWANGAVEKSQKVWMQKCVSHFREQKEPPAPRIYDQMLALNTLGQLSKDILKCVTLPLALIGVLFGALWGMVNPYDGRKIIAITEKLWSIDMPYCSEVRPLVGITNYLAMCMQDVETWKHKNLFVVFSGANDYHPHTFRSIFLALEHLDEKGISHLQEPKETLKNWKAQIFTKIKNDGEEIDENGQVKPDPELEPIRASLLELLSLQKEINTQILNSAPRDQVTALQKRIPQLIANINEAFD